MRALFFATTIFGLVVCKPNAKPHDVVYVGTISGPESDLMNVAKEVALKRYGVKIKIITFNNYLAPNMALNDGELDANVFQHQPYLEEDIKQRHYQLISIGKTFIYPMGLYSKKIKQLSDLHDHALVVIPNDPSNEKRALLLLSKAGLIQLKPQSDFFVTPNDIIKNPKSIQIKELDAAQLVRALPDVDLAAINTNYALLANVYPSRDALLIEDKNSPYINVIVVRLADQHNEKLKILVNALHSKEVQHAANQLFHGQAIPAW